jgi:hypothetical protein
MSLENENFNFGGTGGAIFADNAPAGRRPVPANQQPLGDDYKAPVGLPEWKQPSYDEDDRVDPVSSGSGFRILRILRFGRKLSE